MATSFITFVDCSGKCQAVFSITVEEHPKMNGLYHSVCHDLFGYVDVIPNEFLTDTVNWHSVSISGSVLQSDPA